MIWGPCLISQKLRIRCLQGHFILSISSLGVGQMSTEQWSSDGPGMMMMMMAPTGSLMGRSHSSLTSNNPTEHVNMKPYPPPTTTTTTSAHAAPMLGYPSHYGQSRFELI